MSAGGVDGKWQALLEQREHDRERIETLEKERDGLKAECEQLRGASPEGFAEMASRVRELESTEKLTELFSPDEEERQAFTFLTAFMKMLEHWGLRANQGEMTAAVHVLQAFVLQRMLQRLCPGEWGEWFGETKEVSDGAG